tara:strand:+ start:15050 stop:18211 length:3162 start_codon:yes stop_codon:yes gene_type:complete
MKFAHIADTHIKNLKYHYEYREVFKQIYETLKEKEVDYIVHCGDLAHTKTQLSPEFFEMASDFLKNLADIAPVHMILGNHDGNLKNSSRQDAITPVVEALAHPNLHLHKDACEVVLDGGYALNVLSVFDEDNWVTPTSEDNVNIALYHGAVSGVKTDLGWIMEHGDHDISIFEGFDFAFLGDIHKTNQVLDEDGRVRYAGSTIQQNHGETNDKGLLLWEIQDKDNFTCEHLAFKNPKPFITIELTPKGRMPRGTNIPVGSRLRLVSNNNLPLSRMKKAVDIAKHRFQPESITFLNRAAGQRGTVEDITNSLKVEDLRDPVVQRELIQEYLKEYEVDDGLMDRVVDLNSHYNKIIEQNEEVGRNINWRLRKIEWDNLFNYGEGNSINFENLNGIIGIFGKNYSGKSSVIDSILYTMFNSTSKNERKNLNIINQNKSDCRGKVHISIGERDYTIERTSEKYIKRLKGEETLEAKTDLNFEMTSAVTGDTQSVNGLSRIETDKNIRKHFGTMDDFLLSAMSSQHGSLAFIDEGSTRRKEIIAKFLDLEVFEKKFKLAKEDGADLRGALRRLEGRNYDEEIDSATLSLDENSEKLENQKSKCKSLKQQISECDTRISEVTSMIDSIPAEVINVHRVREELRTAKEEEVSLIEQVQEKSSLREQKEELYSKINDYISTFDVQELNQKMRTIEEILEKISESESEKEIKISETERLNKKIKMLEDHEYDPDCRYCCENKFVKDAHVAKSTLPITERQISGIDEQLAAFRVDLEKLYPHEVEDKLAKYEKILTKKTEVANTIADLNLEIERNAISIEKIGIKIAESTAKIQEYEDNKEAIENLEQLMQDLASYENQATAYSSELESCEACVLELVRENGSLEQMRKSVRDDKEEYLELQEKYAAYDLFMRCMHSNGIAYDVIKKKLPVINQEIAKVLANITNFEVFFEDNGKKFDIFIKHPKHDARPIEMASGAEKTLSAMAIRLAVLSVSSLPKGDLFVLDEPGTALDEENMEGFIRLLQLIKIYFKNVLLISHLDSLKDCVDMQIMIDKKGGFAKISQ